jgi:uncharacterized alpha-E superfamily protein
VLALVRAGMGAGLLSDGDPAVPAGTAALIRARLTADEAVVLPDYASFGQILSSALDDHEARASVAALLARARAIGAGSRERLSPDFWQLLDTPFPKAGLFQLLKARFAALAGLSAEHMGRTQGWRFHDLGRRVERALAMCRLIGAFGRDEASAADLSTLIELCDVQISYRQRYPEGLALLPVRDLVGLDPYNPRSIAFQIATIRDHLQALPRLRDDGMDEPQQSAAAGLSAQITMLRAHTLDPAACSALEAALLELANLIGARFFLRSGEALRASGLTLA